MLAPAAMGQPKVGRVRSTMEQSQHPMPPVWDYTPKIHARQVGQMPHMVPSFHRPLDVFMG